MIVVRTRESSPQPLKIDPSKEIPMIKDTIFQRLNNKFPFLDNDLALDHRIHDLTLQPPAVIR